ncbi:MAG: adenylate kinase [Actinobacteria bacterium]|nr:adenylate kinase [Actinomycetota bacterium]
MRPPLVVFVLLGPPGSGKGTQGARLQAELGLRHVSTGELFREAVRQRTPAGQRAEAYLVSGELVPDEVVMQLVEEFLTTVASRSVLFDGFPRTVRQAEAMEEVQAHLRARLGGVILIDVPDALVLERLAVRGRADDSLETSRYRLAMYHAQTEPLVAYYLARGVLHRVDGSSDVATVGAAVRATVEALR